MSRKKDKKKNPSVEEGKKKKVSDKPESPKMNILQKEEEINSKTGKKFYEEELAKLQLELVKLQEWIKYKGLRVVVIFEGRDAA